MDELQASRAWCADVMRTHAKSFYFSTRLLPKFKREAIEALYGLFRFADDTADEPGPTMETRREIFSQIRRDVAGLRRPGHRSQMPWFAAVNDALERYPIDLNDIERLIRGCESDLEPPSIATLRDLETYAAAVAGMVGRTTLAVLGASDLDSLRRGERLGIAMQFTNVLRDIEEDRRMGRSYLPHASFPGLSTEALVAKLSGVARAYYREAEVLAARLPNDGSRAAVLMAASIYRGILDRLVRGGYDPLRGRVYVPLASKVTIALREIIHAYVGF